MLLKQSRISLYIGDVPKGVQSLLRVGLFTTAMLVVCGSPVQAQDTSDTDAEELLDSASDRDETSEEAETDEAWYSAEDELEADNIEDTGEVEIGEPIPAPVENPAPPKDSVEQVVVTGSRFKRSSLNAPVPVTVVDAKALEDSGSVFLADLLVSTPQIAPTFSSANSTRGIGTTGIGGADLRGLGIDRTLILVNGRRHVGSFSLTPSVDLNTIPVDLIDRFDVLTGGASAVYGADAMAGVINIILKEDFDGFIARSQYNISQRGDAASWFVSATAGGNFADDRGNAVISFEYNYRERLNSSERDFARIESRFLPNPDDTETPDNPGPDGVPDELLFTDAGLNILNRHGVTFLGGSQQTFNPNGSLRPFDFGSYRVGGQQVGGDYVRLSLGDLIPEQERFIATALVNYDIVEKAELYAEAKFVLSRAAGAGSGQPSFDTGLSVARDNAFLPTGLGALMDVAGVSSTRLARFNIDLGQRAEEAERLTLRSVFGVKGDLTDNVSYDVGVTWGQTTTLTRNISNRINDRFFAATDAVVDVNGDVNGRPGEIVCRADLQAAQGETPTLPGGGIFAADGTCVPVSVFGDGGVSQAARDYINGDSGLRESIEQIQVMGFTTFDSSGLFELPGGPLGVVLGAEYRRDDANQRPDLADSLGQTFFNAISPTQGTIEVSEVFAEVSLPLLGGYFLLDEFTINGGGRVSNYNLEQVGTVLTAQINGLYRPTEDLLFRGSFSQAIRSPNVDNAFSALSQNFANVDDPCDEDSVSDAGETRVANCIALAEELGLTFNPGDDLNDDDSRELLSGGNPNIQEETSISWTVGGVITPRWIPNLVLAIDYYNFRIDDAIAAPGAQRIIDNCVDFESIDNEFCDLIQRNQETFEIDLIESVNINLASLKTSGIDFTMSYKFGVHDLVNMFGQKFKELGNIILNVSGNHLIRSVNFPDQNNVSERQDLAGFAGDPAWRWNVRANYIYKGLDFSWRTTWIDGFNRLANRQEFEDNPDAFADDVEARAYHGLQVRYSFLSEFSVYAGIDNLLDTNPPAPFAGTGANSGFYDNLGRRFYFGARWDHF